ncbi:MAG: hypothetical protein N7Q72_07645, partial [Spiroplasma sp. Tabriz.8]|nr:hypothetical protein [Spiroplasma sp. Tabriz.8]
QIQVVASKHVISESNEEKKKIHIHIYIYIYIYSWKQKIPTNQRDNEVNYITQSTSRVMKATSSWSVLID